MRELLKEIANIKSEKKQVREFGYVLAGFLGLVGLIPLGLKLFFHGSGFLHLWGRSIFYGWLFFAAILFLLVAKGCPILIKPVQKIAMTFALLVGAVMSRVILIVVFYGLVTPLGFVVRFKDRNFMDLRIDPEKKSYWADRKRSQPTENASYDKQY